jgi:hypothetical protein
MEGMNIAVHPVLVKPGRVWCNACDNYIVGRSGAYKIHNYPQELIGV